MHAVMAAARGNVRSIGDLTSRERHTFTKQRKPGLTKRPQLWQTDFSTPQPHQQLLQLQQRWQELKERELTAQQHNRRLLQQFEEAQETLTGMLALTAAMKTTRMEYDWYLEENSLCWQQQLKEKTVAAQKKRMEKSYPKNAKERVTSSADQPLPTQGSTTLPQTIAAPPNPYSSSCDSQHGSPHLPYTWLLPPQSQRAGFPTRVPCQPQGSSHVPLSFLPPNIVPHAHPVQLQHLTSTTNDYPPRPRPNPAGGFPLQPDGSCSWPGGISALLSSALWGQVCMEEPPLEMGVAHEAGEDGDISRASSSRKEGGSGDRSSHSSQELDIKPVRLCGGLVESSDGSRDRSPVGREKRRKRKERGRSHCSSSDSSQEAPRHSNATAAVTVAQSSKSDTPSVKGRSSTSRSTRSQGQAVGSSRTEVGAKESHGDDPESHEEESQSTSEESHCLVEKPGREKAEHQSPDDDKSQSSGSQREEEESGSVSSKTANCSGDEIQEVESSSSERCSDGEKVGQDLGDGGDDGNAEEEGKSQTDDKKGGRNEDVSERENTTEEEEDDAREGEDENGKKDFAYCEKEVDESEDEPTEDGESDEEKHGGDVAGEPAEERDSDNSIVIVALDSTKRMHIIEEEASEEDDDNEEESDEDDVENLLAVHQKKEIKELRSDEKPKEFSNMEVFQVELDHPSDSDEFDPFYS